MGTLSYTWSGKPDVLKAAWLKTRLNFGIDINFLLQWFVCDAYNFIINN